MRSCTLWGISGNPSRSRAFLTARADTGANALFILRGSAFSGEPSRTRAFLQALSDKEAPIRTFIHSAGAETLSRAAPSRTRAFLKGSSDKDARVRALLCIARHLFLGRALSLKSLSQSTCGQRKALTAGKRFLKRALSPKSLSQSTLGQGCARSRILQGGASSGSPSRTRAFLKERSYKEEPARTFIHIAGKRFLGRALSRKSLFQSTLGQRGASACIHVLLRGKSFLEQPLSRKSLSQSILGQGCWRVRSLILRRSAFSSNSSRTISFLQAPSDKEVTALALNPLRCKAFSSYPSRTEGFLKALLGR